MSSSICLMAKNFFFLFIVFFSDTSAQISNCLPLYNDGGIHKKNKCLDNN